MTEQEVWEKVFFFIYHTNRWSGVDEQDNAVIYLVDRVDVEHIVYPHIPDWVNLVLSEHYWTGWSRNLQNYNDIYNVIPEAKMYIERIELLLI